MTASFRFSIILLFICLITADVCFAQKAVAENDATKKEAERIWELAVQAKGGRGKLDCIRNIYISSQNSRYSGFKNKYNNEFLIVYPNKYWEWNDKRPSIFGLTMEMYNLETSRKYVVSEGQKDVKLELIEKNDPISRRFSSLIWLILDNKWLHPIPEKVTFLTSGFVNVDVVQTKLNGQRIDFALSKKNHLPTEVSFYLNDSNNGKDNLLYKIHLSNYFKQDGIMVPKTTDNDENFYQFNVEYDENIFTVPPLPAENAANAWKVKK